MAAFWLVLTIACIAWYTFITVYVAVRGVFDIRGMLTRLAASGREEGESPERTD